MFKIINFNKNFYTILFFLIFFAIGIFIFADYGISIDEDNTRIIGFLSLENIFNVFFSEHVELIEKTIGDQRSAHSGLGTSGIVFDLPMAFFEIVFQIEDSRNYYLLRHLINFIFFYISVFVFFKLIYKRFDSWSLSIIGTIFLILSPRIFANSFYNNKDIIFMSLFIICLYAAINFLENKNIRSAVIFALISSLMINLRILGLFLPILIVLFYIINLFSNKNNVKKTLVPLVFFLILTPIFLILFWPYLWENPIDHFINIIKNLSEHNLQIYNYYLGHYIFSENPPWHYSLIWILISTPIFYTALFIIGFLFVFQRALKIFFKKNNTSYIKFWEVKEESYDLIFLLTFLIPVLISVYFGSISYDGWRHLYFIYPSFLLLSILGLQLIKVSLFKGRKKYLFILTLVMIMPTVFWMYKNHPFQYVYFNTLAGDNFNENFEMDYFGVSNKNALDYIAKNESKVVKIFSLSTTDLNLSKKILEKEVRKKIDIVGNIYDADYLTNNFRDWNGRTKPTKFKTPKGFKIIYEIKVDDVSINTIYKKNS